MMLLDAATLYYRAYYALPDSLVSPSGVPVNAIRGFFDGLRTLRDRYEPTRIIACWDEDWRPDWRVALLPSYKTHRLADADDVADLEETPDTLSPQIPVIAEICAAVGIPVVGASEMEADDVIAALAFAATDPVDIVSGDRDLTQLVHDAAGRRLLYLGTGVGKHTVYDDALVLETYGVRPDQYADLAVLRGDPSDGIPGAPGIGAKTAATYLQAFGDLDGVLAAAVRGDRPLTPAKAAVLLEKSDELRRTQQVVTLKPGRVDIPAAKRQPQRIEEIANEYGLSSVLKHW